MLGKKVLIFIILKHSKSSPCHGIMKRQVLYTSIHRVEKVFKKSTFLLMPTKIKVMDCVLKKKITKVLVHIGKTEVRPNINNQMSKKINLYVC